MSHYDNVWWCVTRALRRKKTELPHAIIEKHLKFVVIIYFKCGF